MEGTMDPSSIPETQAITAAVQLSALAAALAGVLLGAALLAGWQGWAVRRRPTARAAAPTAGDADDAEGHGAEPDRPVASNLIMTCAFILAALLLPAAAAVRQLWPHPDFGWTTVACWGGVLVPVVAVWLALARATAPETPRRGGRP
jgi:hypothetical protein